MTSFFFPRREPVSHFDRWYYELCSCHSHYGHSQPADYFPVTSLKEAADSGCPICLVVFTGLKTALADDEDFDRLVRFDMDLSYIVRFKLKELGELRVRYRKGWDADLGHDTRQKFEIYLGRGQETLGFPLDTMANYREIHQYPLSAGGFERIKQLVDICVKSHDDCNKQSTTFFPQRLIRVADDGSLPRLHISSGEEYDYVALSHCWGKFPMLTTTTATLEERKSGIKWSELPKTFQDAIRVTKVLGIRYIWIDSLCILQDDQGDWETESSKMGGIYRNAYLTIAASQSSSGSEGFLKPRTDYVSKEFSVKHDFFPGGSARFKIRKCLPKHLRHDVAAKIRDPFRDGLAGPAGEMQPLDYRGWAFQEKLVSRRLLSFCSKEIEWDCLECFDCECGEGYKNFFNDGVDFRNASARQTYQGLVCLEEAIRSEKDPEQLPKWQKRIREEWHSNIVPTYTQLLLTKESDRLPALSMIAQSLEKSLADQYICGLWRADLDVGLVWKSGAWAANAPSPGIFLDGTNTPSWSWASIHGPVYPAFDTIENIDYPLIKVVDLRLVAAGKIPCANVEFGHVRLLGNLLPASLSVQYTKKDKSAGGDKVEYEIRFAGKDSSSGGTFWPDCDLALQNSSFHRVKTKSSSRLFGGMGEVSCLATVTVKRFEGGLTSRSVPYDTRDIVFLVLSSSTRLAGAYERIGCFRVATSSLPEKWMESWPQSDILLV